MPFKIADGQVLTDEQRIELEERAIEKFQREAQDRLQRTGQKETP